MRVEYPMGVTLPIDAAADAAMITPEVRGEIRTGAYSTDLIGRLPDAVMRGDRVLVIGGGLGVVSTLVARAEGIDRVIVTEPNTLLLRYIARVHDLNGLSEVEAINAVLAVGKRGSIPFCAQHDPRTSLFMPENQSLQQATMVPVMDLNMILVEEQINVIVCDTPTAPAQLLAQADLGQVDRILLNHGSDVAQSLDGDGICTQLAARGYHPEPSGTAILLRRSTARRSGSTRVVTPANLNSAPSLANLG